MSVSDLEFYGDTSTGTIDANAENIASSLPAVVPFVSIQLVGSPTGTVQFEASLDGITWASLAMTPAAGGAAVTSATAAGLWSNVNAAYRYIRVRSSAWTSGAFTVYIVRGG